MSRAQTATAVTDGQNGKALLVKPVDGDLFGHPVGVLQEKNCLGYTLDEKKAWYAKHLADPTLQFRVVCKKLVTLEGTDTKVPYLKVVPPPSPTQTRSIASWQANYDFLVKLVRRTDGKALDVHYGVVDQDGKFVLGFINGGDLGPIETILHWSKVCPATTSREDRIDKMEAFLDDPLVVTLELSAWNDNWKVGDEGRPYVARLIPVSR